MKRSTARSLATVAGSLAILLRCASAQAQPPPRVLRYDLAVDAPLAIAGSALVITAPLVLDPVLAPSRCRWCTADSFDASARAALVWPQPAVADIASDVGSFVLAPAAAFGLDALAAWHDGSLHAFPVDALLIAEATMAAGTIDYVTKLLTARRRPSVNHSYDDNLSFFSGHTTEAFALASSAGTVSTLRGYRWAPITWIVGGAVGFATGYLRIAADRHWLTDVLVGLVVGAGVGFLVPYAFHRAQ